MRKRSFGRQGPAVSATYLWLALILLAFPSVSAAKSDVILSASVLRYDPTPAEQGSVVDVWVQFSNSGVRVDDVKLRFVPRYPFSAPESQPVELSVGTIAASETKIVKFPISIARDAASKEYNASFSYQWSQAGPEPMWAELEVPIELRTLNPAVVIESYSVSPTPVVPGQRAELSLNLRNAGAMAVKNVDVVIEPGEFFGTSSSGTKKRVEYIPPGGSTLISFALVTDPASTPNVHSVPVNLTYQDERNRNASERQSVSVVVNALPEIDVLVDRVTFIDGKQPGSVLLKVVNRGVVDVKYVTLTLAQSETFELLSPSGSVYVGNVDSDDFETVEFKLRPTGNVLLLPVSVSFKDPYNTAFESAYDLEARVRTENDFAVSSFPWGSLVIGLVGVALIATWWFRSRRRKGRAT